MKKPPLTIGELKLNDPFVLAPLAGITDRSMRSLCHQAGASLTYTEMVSAKGLWYGDRKTGELLQTGPEEGPVGFQLFGSEPEILGYAVRVLSDPAYAKAVDAEMEAKAGQAAQNPDTLGNAGGLSSPGAFNSAGVNRPPMGARTVRGLTPPVLFDLNAGCPVPKIVRNGEGSALLKDPQLVYDCISAMCDAAKAAATMKGEKAAEAAAQAAGTQADSADPAGSAHPIPVTIKIRKGFERDDNCAVEIAKAAEAAGAAAVTVHGRTRQQFYEGKADWDVIRAVKEAVRIPVIGNGDVRSGADAIRMMEETGCDGVMIARGALGNPWIFREACALWDEQTAEPGQRREFRPLAQGERIDQLLRHIDLVCEDKGERVAVREMRKQIGWYIKGMHGATQVRRQINATCSVEEMKRVLESLGQYEL